MANPLNSLLNNTPQMSSSESGIAMFQRMAHMLQSANNPSAAINALAQQNPQVREVMQLCSGKNPRDVFIQECRSRGINPDELMSKLGLH